MRVLKLREGFDVGELRTLYRRAEDRRTAERLLAVYLRAKGKTPPQIAELVGRHVDTVRDWIRLFNEGGPDMLVYRHSGGRAGKLSREQEERLAEWLREGKPDGGRWTLSALAVKLEEECGVSISQQQIWERIIRMGLRHLMSRPRKAPINAWAIDHRKVPRRL